MRRCPKCEALLFLIGGTGNEEVDNNLPIRCSCGYTSDPIIPLSRPPIGFKPSSPNDFDQKYAEVQQKLNDFAIKRLGIPEDIVNPPEQPNDPTS